MVAFILCSPSVLSVSAARVKDHTARQHKGLRPWGPLVALGIDTWLPFSNPEVAGIA